MPPASLTSAVTMGTAARANVSASSSSGASRRVPIDKRKRTETSCDKCKSRKQKCRKEPGQESCRYCIVHNIECQATQPRKKRLYGSVEGLGSRLALLEAIVKGLQPETDVSSTDDLRRLGHSLGVPLPGSPLDDVAGDDRSSGSDGDGDDSSSLLPDQQGQVQYIGPASSFSFHLKLRSLVGRGAPREFVLFGRNAADQGPIEGDGGPHALSTPGTASSTIDHNSPADPRCGSAPEAPSLELLIAAYFDHVNFDFPVLHELSFREAYEAWLVNPGAADPAWLCGFLCVLLLARRVARVNFPEDQERLWWRRVQTLLPVVIFTSSVAAVQAMMLAALHLHNTNHRDACWNLTGTAVRIAYAIGLHQNRVNTTQTPLARELRKRLWWTLYAFEQIQVSSYDRPSAIEHPAPKIGCPNNRIIGNASYSDPDYCTWFMRLIIHLGSACRAPKTIKAKSVEESYVGPLSAAAAVLRDLERWKERLPRHLRVDALDTAVSAFQRPLLMMHAQYHYTIIVLCRAALLARASVLSKEGHVTPDVALNAMAESCSVSGRQLATILLRLDAYGKYNEVTWWDTWYCLTASSVLVLDLVCLNKLQSTDMPQARILLSQLADLAQRQCRNPHVPGTLHKFASLVPELHTMVDSLRETAVAPLERKSVELVNGGGVGPVHLPHHQPQQLEQYPAYHQSTTNSGAFMLTDNAPGRFYPEHDYAAGAYPMPRMDRNMQMGFMDFTINNINEWNWNDLGSLLGPDSVPQTQNHPQTQPHPHSHGLPHPQLRHRVNPRPSQHAQVGLHGLHVQHGQNGQHGSS